jgi:urease accessory protein
MDQRSPTHLEEPLGGVRLQRAIGSARLVVKRRGERSVLAELHQQTPCRVLFPDVEAGDPFQAVMLTTSGGLTGGDRISIRIGAEAGTMATVTTQAAEKIYRSLGPDCHIDVALDVADAAWLEWLPQETILFDRSRLKRRTEAHLAPGASLLAVEIVLFGRTASGEMLNRGRLHDAWFIRRGGALIWADAVALGGDNRGGDIGGGDIRGQRAAPFGFGASCGYATVICAAPAAAGQLEPLRAALAGAAAEIGATVVGGVLLIRLLDPDAGRLRDAAGRAVCILRERLAGLPARLPRVWHV